MSANTPPPSAASPMYRLHPYWYIACRSSELRAEPVARTILGIPLVLFRDETGSAKALVDRCPHRNVPLSFGKVSDGKLVCGYHGWAFDGEGACRDVPGFTGEPNHRTRCASSHAIVEQQGYIWVFMSAGVTPESKPFEFPHMDTKGYTVVRRDLEAECSLHAMAENALDVPHTAFLHGGLFRSESVRNPIQAVIQRFRDHVEAEYIGEPRPTGIAARLLSPSGGVVTHFDRFFLPSIIQVEYRIGDENHIVLNGACTPVSETHTRMFAVVTANTRVPAWLLKPILLPIGLHIFGQDQVVLRLQTQTIQTFGEEDFASTEIDLLGRHIQRLLRLAEAGQLPDSDEVVATRDITMMV